MKKESYKSKNKKTKSTYSLRKLIPEITGIPNLKDALFDAEYKAVQRIVKVMKNITGNNEVRQRIPHEEKDSFIIITRNLYNMIKNDQSGEGQELFARMAAEELLTGKEYEKLIGFFKEGFKANPELPLNKLLIERVNSDDSFYQLQDGIEQLVQRDINLLVDLDSHSVREQRIKEYLSFLKDSSEMNAWRNSVESDLKAELFKKKIIAIAMEKGLDVKKVLEGKDHDLLEEVTGEIIKRDIEAYLRNMDETDS
ncbi:hypothetical protein [Niallia hominis]|uniref:Uncharacterized protein n=1 Tax=Niallia hominis TaxID=3133173 RepID=A0ABV1EVL0_9BACI